MMTIFLWLALAPDLLNPSRLQLRLLVQKNFGPWRKSSEKRQRIINPLPKMLGLRVAPVPQHSSINNHKNYR